MSPNPPGLERLTTGSAAFDRILGGGLPVRSVNVIAGEPGAGKTLFALQMLFALARQGKKGLYLTTLSEPSLKLLQYMQQFSFFDESLIDRGIVFADLGSVIRRKGAEATLSEITGRVEREEPAVVVIDSFKAVRDILGDAAALRTFVYDLAVHTAGWGAASLLVGEYTEAEAASDAEFAIADGIIRFTNSRHELTAVREVEVLKLRGADYVTGGHFYEIGSDGLAFFPRVRGPDSIAAEAVGARPAGLDPGAGLDGGRRARRHARRRAAPRERDRRPGRDGNGQDPAGPAVPARGGAARRSGDPLHAGGDPGPASRDRARPGVGSPGVRGARAADAQLRLARRAVDRPLPRPSAAGGGEARGAARRARQPDQHGPRRSFRPAIQGARLRVSQSTSTPAASRST